MFTRKEYQDIVLERLRYCQEAKGLRIHSWCLMSNHVHMIVSAENNNTSDVVRDFKKFTSKQILKAIAENVQESRKEWILKNFEKAGEGNSRNA